MFPRAKKYLIILYSIVIMLASLGIASADTVTIDEYYEEGGRLVVHVYYTLTGTRTLEVWAQDPLDENSSYFISEKTVTGRGIETIIGECCFRLPNRYEGKTTKCFCANPSIRIE
jgi:hypothetical protein